MVDLSGVPILSLIIFTPLVGALLLALIPGGNLRAIRYAALGVARSVGAQRDGRNTDCSPSSR